MKTPRYLELKQLLKDKIRQGEYKVGDRLPSENELASQHQVSRHTVLKGMAQLMAEGWIERYQGRGTFVAHRSEGTPQGIRTVALLCSDLSDPPIMHIVAGVSGFLKEHQMELLILDCDHSTAREAAYLDSLEDRGVSGALVWPYAPPANREHVDILRQRGIPIVLLDRGYEGLTVPMVGVDNMAGAFEVTQYLIRCGHRRIGHITVDQAGRSYVPAVANREKGFRSALAATGLSVSDAYVQRVPLKLVEESMTSQAVRDIFAYEAMHHLLTLPEPPTAVFLLNDLFAPSCLRAISTQGLRVPEDIAIAGFDNDFEAGEFAVPLTSYAQPGREIGRMAGELLKQMLDGQIPKETENLIPGRLIVRHSTGWGLQDKEAEPALPLLKTVGA